MVGIRFPGRTKEPSLPTPRLRNARAAHGTGIFGELLQVAKDQEGVWAQLVTGCGMLEEQLQSLRREHEVLQAEVTAVRTCLDKAGRICAADVDRESKGIMGIIPGSDAPSDAACAVPRGSVSSNTSSVKRHIAPSTPRSSITDSAQQSPDPPAEAIPRSVAWSDSPAARAGGSWTASPGSLFDRTLQGTALEAECSSPPPTRTSISRPTLVATGGGARGRSISAQSFQSARREGASSRTRSCSSNSSPDVHAWHSNDPIRSPRRPRAKTQPANQENDLYALMLPLLDRTSGVTEQQRALRLLQRFFRNHTDPPNCWSGPGTPLHTVVRAGRSDLVRLLLRARANANERDAKGVCPLHLAVFDGSTEVIRLLLAARSDVNTRDCYGQTPLFFAPLTEVCRLLLEKRTDTAVLNRKGQTALHLAGRAGLSEVLVWLSARVGKQLIELKDVTGMTARGYLQQIGLQKREATKGQGRSPQMRVQNASPAPVPSGAGAEPSLLGEEKRTERRASRTPELFSMAATDSPNPDSWRLCRDTSLEAMYGGLSEDQSPGVSCGGSVEQTLGSPSPDKVALEAAAFVATAAVTTAAASLEEHSATVSRRTLAGIEEEAVPSSVAGGAGAVLDPAEQPQAPAEVETVVKLGSITSSEVIEMDQGGATVASAPQASAHGEGCSHAAFAAAGPAYTAPAELMTSSDGEVALGSAAEVEEVLGDGIGGAAMAGVSAQVPTSTTESDEDADLY